MCGRAHGETLFLKVRFFLTAVYQFSCFSVFQWWPSVAPTDCYDLTTGKWEVKADIPQNRAGSSYGVTCDGRLMVAGGEGDGKAWSNVDVFDGEKWETIDNLNVGRHGSGLAVEYVALSIGVPVGRQFDFLRSI